MKKAVAFLQNAWSPLYAGGTWPRESWLSALHRSRTGQRLRLLINAAEHVEWWFDNTTPIVGDTPDSVVPPDFRHMARVIRKQQPTVVVCMGKQAAKAWTYMGLGGSYCHIPTLIMPHPAYRVLSDSLLWEAAELLEDGFTGIRELKQQKPVRR